MNRLPLEIKILIVEQCDAHAFISLADVDRSFSRICKETKCGTRILDESLRELTKVRPLFSLYPFALSFTYLNDDDNKPYTLNDIEETFRAVRDGTLPLSFNLLARAVRYHTINCELAELYLKHRQQSQDPHERPLKKDIFSTARFIETIYTFGFERKFGDFSIQKIKVQAMLARESIAMDHSLTTHWAMSRVVRDAMARLVKKETFERTYHQVMKAAASACPELYDKKIQVRHGTVWTLRKFARGRFRAEFVISTYFSNRLKWETVVSLMRGIYSDSSLCTIVECTGDVSTLENYFWRNSTIREVQAVRDVIRAVAESDTSGGSKILELTASQRRKMYRRLRRGAEVAFELDREVERASDIETRSLGRRLFVRAEKVWARLGREISDRVLESLNLA